MIWLIVIGGFVAGLVWILAGPVILFVNTRTNRYHVALPGIFRAAVIPSGEWFKIRAWILFIPFTFDPFTGKKKRAEKDEDKPKRRGGLLRGMKGLPMLKDTAGSFRIRRLYLDVDTDDVILNAWLIPAFSAVNGNNIRMRVNFEGHSSLLLDLRTHLGALLWIFIKNQYRSMFNR